LALFTVSLSPAMARAHGDEAKVGTVREVAGGPGPRAELAAEDGQRYVLRGRTPDDDAELRRLAGVKVRLFGASEPSQRFAVDHFEILDVGGGVVPVLGTIAALEGEARLLFVDERGRAAFLPAGFASKLKDQVGAKVWVVAKPSGDKLAVSRFAILRPGPGPRAPGAPAP
jgi:hypothetical protein